MCSVLKRLTWIGCVLVCSLFVKAASAENEGLENLEVNFAIGGHFGGDVYFDPPDRDFDADGGFYFKIGADYFFTEVIGAGFYLSHGQGEITAGGSDFDFDFTEFGLALKPRYTIKDFHETWDLALGPNIYIGYRVENVDGAPGDDSGDGLGLNLGIDIRVMFENGFAFFIEPGFISQPDGGSSDADVEWDPIGTFLVGVGYGF